MSHPAYCGFDCEACPVFNADTPQRRAALAARYGRPPEQIPCGGCQSAAVNAGFCGGCTLRTCARGKGLPHCAACPAYPCPAVERALPADTPGRVRLDALRPYRNSRNEESSMRYDWLDAFLLAHKGVSKNLQPDWNWVRYVLADKLFAAVCLDGHDRPYYITLKLPPEEGRRLREEYPEDVLPGYYMNKVHWNSVKPDGAVPDAVLQAALTQAYELVLYSLSKKKQAELLGE